MRLVEKDRAFLFAFEPDARERKKLREHHRNGAMILDHFVGDGDPAVFHETISPLTGSLFEPNSELLLKFQGMYEATTPVRTHEVRTRRLDDIDEIAESIS